MKFKKYLELYTSATKNWKKFVMIAWKLMLKAFSINASLNFIEHPE